MWCLMVHRAANRSRLPKSQTPERSTTLPRNQTRRIRELRKEVRDGNLRRPQQVFPGGVS